MNVKKNECNYNDEIKNALQWVYKDLVEWKIYREATFQASLYFHLRNSFKNKIIYSEFTDVITRTKYRYDFVISEKSINNNDHENWTKMENIEAIIEIKFISYTYKRCIKAINEDINKFKKLNRFKKYKEKQKYIVFIFQLEEKHAKLDKLSGKDELDEKEKKELKREEEKNKEKEKENFKNLCGYIKKIGKMNILGYAWYWEELELIDNLKENTTK